MDHNNFGAKVARGSPLGSAEYYRGVRDTTGASGRPETGRNIDTDKHGARCPDQTHDAAVTVKGSARSERAPIHQDIQVVCPQGTRCA